MNWIDKVRVIVAQEHRIPVQFKVIRPEYSDPDRVLVGHNLRYYGPEWQSWDGKPLHFDFGHSEYRIKPGFALPEALEAVIRSLDPKNVTESVSGAPGASIEALRGRIKRLEDARSNECSTSHALANRVSKLENLREAVNTLTDRADANGLRVGRNEGRIDRLEVDTENQSTRIAGLECRERDKLKRLAKLESAIDDNFTEAGVDNTPPPVDEYIYFSGEDGMGFMPKQWTDEFENWRGEWVPCADASGVGFSDTFFNGFKYRRLSEPARLAKDGWISSDKEMPGVHRKVEVMGMGVQCRSMGSRGVVEERWFSLSGPFMDYRPAKGTYWRPICK